MKFVDVVGSGEDVLTARSSSLGLVSLNRPRIINSLSLSMVRAIDAALDSYEADAGIAAVLVYRRRRTRSMRRRRHQDALRGWQGRKPGARNLLA